MAHMGGASGGPTGAKRFCERLHDPSLETRTRTRTRTRSSCSHTASTAQRSRLSVCQVLSSCTIPYPAFTSFSTPTMTSAANWSSPPTRPPLIETLVSGVGTLNTVFISTWHNLETDRYNPSNVSILEDYLYHQIRSEEYDCLANLAILKLCVLQSFLSPVSISPLNPASHTTLHRH